MNKQLVIFVTTPLIQRDIKIYGVDFYEQQGINTYFFNLWPLFSKGLQHKTDINFKNQIEIDSVKCLYTELLRFKKQNSIFLSDVGFRKKSFILYLLLTVLRIEYSFVDNWYAILPDIKFKERFLRNVRKNLFVTLIKILKLFEKYILSLPEFVFEFFLRKPKFVFLPTKKSFHSKIFIGKKTIIIPYSSFNYDDFITAEESNVVSILNENYFVFIDQYLTNLPDFARNGTINPLTSDYYNSLNSCFNKIKSDMCVEFVIAAHPRRSLEEKKVFDTENLFIYKTFNLIRYSDFVIAHYSNSIFWAVLLNKPVVLIITNEMKGTFIEDTIRAFADELKQEVYNIDDEFKININDLSVNKLVYEQFITNHIVYNRDTKLKTYEIIYNTILK